MLVFLVLVFALIAGTSKAIEDICSESSFYKSKLVTIFKLNSNYWQKSESSCRKWKNCDKSQGESFWGSSRWFVMFTDGWHLMDSTRTLFSFLSGGISVLCFQWYYSIPVVILIMLIIFEIAYYWLKQY